MVGQSALRPLPYLLVIGILAAYSTLARAQPSSPVTLAATEIASSSEGLAALLERVRLRRTTIKEMGVEIGTTYVGETFSNLRGGLRRGAVFEGRLDIQLDADLEKLAGFEGLSLHSNAYQIHGTGLSRYFTGSLAYVSSIEALPSTRLVELWLEQANADKTLTLRAGKLLADAEFFVSPTATLFANATFGWPVLAATNLPSGGPSTPLATPGIRVKWSPIEKASVSFGLYDGNPAPASALAVGVDPQRRNPNGTDFTIRGNPLVLLEAAKTYMVEGPGPEKTGTIKLGYFHHFGRFDDLRYDRNGVPLASLVSTGLPQRRRSSDGVYAVIDQTLFREDQTSDRGAAGFVRFAASPNASSPISVYLDMGLVYKGLLRNRPDDIVGVSLGYSRLSNILRAADHDYALYQSLIMPLRRSELIAELTYQAVIGPGITVQPDIQYIASPGGHTWNSRRHGYQRVKNSTVIGLRATFQY